MLPVEHIAGLRVVEALWGGVPAHHREVRTVVIGVAFYAGCTGRSRPREGGVKPLVLL